MSWGLLIAGAFLALLLIAFLIMAMRMSKDDTGGSRPSMTELEGSLPAGDPVLRLLQDESLIAGTDLSSLRPQQLVALATMFPDNTAVRDVLAANSDPHCQAMSKVLAGGYFTREETEDPSAVFVGQRNKVSYNLPDENVYFVSNSPGENTVSSLQTLLTFQHFVAQYIPVEISNSRLELDFKNRVSAFTFKDAIPYTFLRQYHGNVLVEPSSEPYPQVGVQAFGNSTATLNLLRYLWVRDTNGDDVIVFKLKSRDATIWVIARLDEIYFVSTPFTASEDFLTVVLGYRNDSLPDGQVYAFKGKETLLYYNTSKEVAIPDDDDMDVIVTNEPTAGNSDFTVACLSFSQQLPLPDVDSQSLQFSIPGCSFKLI